MAIPKTLNNWLQPHEGVTGKDLPDDPVLTMAPSSKIILANVTNQLYRALVFSTHPRPPILEDRYQRLLRPEPGDYVVIKDIVGRGREDDWLKGVGVFLGDRQEWWQTNEQWEADKAEDETLTDDSRSTDHAWYVQYLPDARSVCRWVNCELLALPEGGF